MYKLIRQFFEEKQSILLTALLYALMFIAILYFSFEQEAKFNYLVL